MVVMLDNESIHIIEEVKLLVKKIGWVVFAIIPYKSELNQMENTFWIIKSKMSKKEL